MRRYVIPLSLLLLFLLGHLRMAAQGSSVQESEALNLGKQLEVTMNNGDPRLMHHLLDMPSLIARIQAKCKAAQDPAFVMGFLERANLSNFGNQTLAIIQSGSYRLIRAYSKNGQRHLLFRMFGKGGLNYQDFTLEKIGDSVKAVDIFAFIAGDELSSIIVRTVNLVVASTGSNLSELQEEGKQLRQISELRTQGNYQGIKDLFEKLSPSFQQDKNFQIVYIQACQHISMEAYKAALEHYASLFPDAPNIYLLMLDLYVLDKEFDKCLHAVDKMDSLVQGDPFLNFMRGNVLEKMGKTAESRDCFRKTFDYDPSIWQNMQQLVRCSVRDKDLDSARSVMARYKSTDRAKQDYIDQLIQAYPELKQ